MGIMLAEYAEVFIDGFSQQSLTYVVQRLKLSGQLDTG
jgi:hypothetical protein